MYGVDCSGIIHSAKQIVKDSGFERKVTLIHGKIEEISLPVDKVDVIVSEWMGYALFCQLLPEPLSPRQWSGWKCAFSRVLEL